MDIMDFTYDLILIGIVTIPIGYVLFKNSLGNVTDSATLVVLGVVVTLGFLSFGLKYLKDFRSGIGRGHK